MSMMVDAAAGATLLLDDGASVQLPPGALATDAEVSFSRETCDGVYVCLLRTPSTAQSLTFPRSGSS